MKDVDDSLFESAASLCASIRSKDISALELVDAYLNRIQVVNTKINAVVQLAGDRARQEAKQMDHEIARGTPLGPLHGLPITLKDSIDTEGIVTTWSTRGRAKFVPEQDATVAQRLRNAGAIVIGKTNTPELTVGGEMDSPVYGQTHNPYDLSKSPGGSSGGAAANVAIGGSAFDLGSDTGGSIREPAHMCGISGIKPTTGRVPGTGHAISFGNGIVDGLTQIGPMARFVEDLDLVLPLISGPDRHDPGIVPVPMASMHDVRIRQLRLALYTEGGLAPLDPEIERTVIATGQHLMDMGAAVEQRTPAVLGRAAEIFNWVNFADHGDWLRRLLRRIGTHQPGPHLSRLLEDAALVDAPAVNVVLAELQNYRANMLGFMNDFDAVICPVEAVPAIPHGVTKQPDRHDGWAHMNAYNLTGWPAGVVRAGATSTGLPIGVQVVGRPWREDVVLALLKAIEAFGGFRPPQTGKNNDCSELSRGSA